MNLITFGFSEKGTPVFLNQEPFPQVGTLYMMKAGENSVIGITLDDKLVKLAQAPGKTRGRKAKTEEVKAAPKKRGRKAKVAVGAAEAAPAKRGRKPKSEAVESAPKKARKPRAKKEKAVESKPSEG